MSNENTPKNVLYLGIFTSRKDKGALTGVSDSLSAWMERYFQMAVTGVRPEAVAQKIALHLRRFKEFFSELYGHERR